MYYDPAQFLDSIESDAINFAFFSVGVCISVFFSYGSYNEIKRPIIRNAIIIGLLDFAFAFLCGFLTWSVIGFLISKNNVTYVQTSNTGLTFVAIPVAATLDPNGKTWFGVFMFFMFISGIDSAFAMMEGLVTCIIDYYRCTRLKACTVVIVAGILLSIPFCSNAGWLLVELVDHYISDYIIIFIGLFQCVSVAWIWEYESTAVCSDGHRTSLRILTFTYWITTIFVTFYSVFGANEGERSPAFIVLFILNLLGAIWSYYKSGMRFR
jgi:SNF family Na+-dependent transporter